MRRYTEPAPERPCACWRADSGNDDAITESSAATAVVEIDTEKVVVAATAKEPPVSLDGTTAPPLCSSQKDQALVRKRIGDEEGGTAEFLTRPWKKGWERWAMEDVATSALVPALVTQALATGLLDATTYADFSTFASNQTGNAILLTVAAVGTRKVLVLLTGVSLGGFLGFAFIFGHIGHWFGVRRRLWLLVSVFIQTILMVLAAIFLSPHGPPALALGAKHEWVVLFLFASMSGAQVAMARQSSCQELPTAPMTSTFVDFVSDPFLFAGMTNKKATGRNRRLYYIIAMLGGSFIGAAMHRYSTSWVIVTISVGIKLCVLPLIMFARADEKQR